MSDISPPVVLTAEHDVSRFECGSPELNRWLQESALNQQRAMLSRTYAALSSGQVAGYYTLAHCQVTSTEAPKKLGRGMPRSIPGMLMARFAVDQSWQGRGLGRSLFVDALTRTWAVMEQGPAPVRLFVVDAKDDAAVKFYQKFDMTSGPHDPFRLFLHYKDLRGLFG